MARVGVLAMVIIVASTSCEARRDRSRTATTIDAGPNPLVDGSSASPGDTAISGRSSEGHRESAADGDAQSLHQEIDSDLETLDEPQLHPPEVPQKALTADELRAVVQQTRDERRWKTKVNAPTQEFVKSISASFDSWGKVLTQLSAAGQQAEADRLCKAIIDLRDHFGPKLLPMERYDSFIRDRFWIESSRVEAAQYFEPVRYYPTDDRILKLFRLSVYSKGRVFRRYYLESSSLTALSTYVLGRADDDSRQHHVVVEYGAERPTYWKVKADVMDDLGAHEKNHGSSSGSPTDATKL